MAPRGYRVTISSACLVATALAALGSPVAVKPWDDRGQEIGGELKICFSKSGNTSCVERSPYLIPAGFEEFEYLSAEGPRHGPFEAARASIKRVGDNYTITVTRKAALRVTGAAEGKLSLSLYSPNDASFRRPVHRFDAIRAEETMIPAGDHLAVLSGGGAAPQLQLLTAKPGVEEVMAYEPMPGWSLIIRCLSQPNRKPVSKGSIRALSRSSEAAAPQAPSRPPRLKAKDELILLVGLVEPYLSAEIRAPGFLPSEIRGVSTRPGTFTFREVLLGRGGSIEARIQGGTSSMLCVVLDPATRGPAPEEAPKVVWQNSVARDGRCVANSIPEGTYVFRVKPQQSDFGSDQTVSVENDQNVRLTFDLERTPVSGRVTRGTAPEADAQVLGRRIDNGVPTDLSSTASATTDDRGEYSLELWSPGRYLFLVKPGAGPASDMKFVSVPQGGTNVDFTLNPHRVEGITVDQNDGAIPEAVVFVRFNDRNIRLLSDASGRFEFSLAGEGIAEVSARKQGYLSAPSQVVTIESKTPPPSVVLRLEKRDSVRGKLLSVVGLPLSGAVVMSYQQLPGRAPEHLDRQLTGVDGSFELTRAPVGSTRLFVTGAGCPLTFADSVVANEETLIRCSVYSAGLNLTLRDEGGQPYRGVAIALVRDGSIIPRAVLALHLGQIGLPFLTSAAGRLDIVGLEPGNYQLFVMTASSEETIAAGLGTGHLTSTSLAPFETAELEIQFRAR